MVMANRDVHVFENEIDGNQTAAVLVLAYSKDYADLTYNPLPRDIVVRDNKIGKNGWKPGFPGGDVLAQGDGREPAAGRLGRRLQLHPQGPDGAGSRPGAADRRAGGQSEFRRARRDHVGQPDIKPTIDDGAIAEPKPVVLPKPQSAL